MTVKELIEELSVFNQDLPVNIEYWPSNMNKDHIDMRIFCKLSHNEESKCVKIHCDIPGEVNHFGKEN